MIGDKSDILPSFINLTEILSTPVAFLTLKLSMTLDTNVSLVDLNSKLFFTKFLSSIVCKLGWSFLLKI